MDAFTNQEGIPNTGVSTKYQTHYVKIFKVCVDGDFVKTINPIKTCAKWGYKKVRCSEGSFSADGNCYDKDQRECKQYLMRTGMAPLQTQKQKCVKWENKDGSSSTSNRDDDNRKCLKYKPYTSKKRTSWTFDIYKNFNNDRRNSPMLTVDVEIPQCQSK